MSADDVLVDEASARDADLLVRAIVAAGAGNAERAADLTVMLVFRRTSEEVYGVCGGVAQYAVNALHSLNNTPGVPGAPGGGAWTFDHLRPEDLSTEPGQVFARAFLRAYAEDGVAARSTIDLHNAMVSSGVAYTTYCLSHLIRHVAEIAGAAIGHQAQVSGRRPA